MDPVPTHHPEVETLHAYRLGRLEVQPAKAVRRHLEQCSACRKRFSALASERLAADQDATEEALDETAPPVTIRSA